MPKLLFVVLAAVAAAGFSAAAGGVATAAAPAASKTAAAAKPAVNHDPSQPVRAVTAEMGRIAAVPAGPGRDDAVRTLLRGNFDLAYMARNVLGAHWNEANEQQRARFVAALEASESKAYAERLSALSNFTVTVDRVTSRPDGSWTVDSSAGQNGGFPVKLAWEVRDGGQGPRIVDVRVGGVSLFATRQSEFNSVIRKSNGSIEPLVEAMEARAR